MSASNNTQPSIFDLACRAFDGWIDPDTGLRVLRLLTLEQQERAGFDWGAPLRTVYHQYNPFVDGGRKVLLRASRSWPMPEPPPPVLYFLDLTNGEVTPAFSQATNVADFCDAAGTAVYPRHSDEGTEVVLEDFRAKGVLARFALPGWRFQEAHPLADGRALCTFCQGRFPNERVHSRLFLLSEEGVTELADEDGYFINHLQGCPTDPLIYAYDKWPTPKEPVDVVIHIAHLDGSFNEPMKQLPTTIRPGSLWGGQRDHYLWSPDGRRILSYLSPYDCADGDHFDYGWWITALDWRTGEDLCVPYPPERWGGNFAVSPDSRYIVSAGGYNYQQLYLVDIEGLRDGWNERPLCTYPDTLEFGRNGGRPLHMPHVLPDQSGVVFLAGWPGPEYGVYMVEWPIKT